MRDDAQGRVVELDADLDEVRASDRVDPEGPADMAPDLLGEASSKNWKNGFGAGGGKGVERHHLHVEIQPIAGDPLEHLVACRAHRP